jgi:hypothetical protein
MTKYIVMMNGVAVVEFGSDKWANPEKMARDYIDMQKRSIKGAGLAKSAADVPEIKKSFAAKQNWEMKVTET